MNYPTARWLQSRPNVAFLFIASATYTLVSALAQIKFPHWTNSAFSPVELATWLGVFFSAVATINKISNGDASGSQRRYRTLAITAIIAISILQSADWFTETWTSWNTPDFLYLNFFANTTLAIIAATALIWSAKLGNDYRWIIRCLMAVVVFQLITMFSEVVEWGNFPGTLPPFSGLSFSTELAELLCIEAYFVSLALSGDARPASNLFTKSFDAQAPGLFVGSNARNVYRDCRLYRGAKHPPLAISFYPGFSEITFFLVMAWLVLTAGVSLKRGTGKTLLRQVREMTVLWFKQGIDPPSYYALDLYEVSRLREAPHFLTRYETKNGLLASLNSRRPKPYKKNEMSHKEMFAACCREFNLPHPQQLLLIHGEKIAWNCSKDDLQTDLFCKRQHGMGAMGTITFRWLGASLYADEAGKTHDLDSVLKILGEASGDHPLIVQPWLKNHSSLFDLAKDSLITIRVITCLDERGSPEVTLAMLRLLAKLEPDWQFLPDEEYAAPIDLQSGEMGLFTGDNFRTSHIRYENHPVTHAPIKGRVIARWNDIMATAIKAHQAFAHRCVIGWDIALTENGPVILEGNSNFDVMFLQRVHGVAAGRTKLGELLNFQLRELYHDKMRSGLTAGKRA